MVPFNCLTRSDSDATPRPSFILRQAHALFSIHHAIVPDTSGIERAMVKDHYKFDVHAMGMAMLKRIFGYQSGDMPRAEYARMHDEFMKALSRDFVNEEAATAALYRTDIPKKISSLISFTEDANLQQPWERAVGVKLVSTGEVPVAEFNLESLLKSLGFCISIPLLYGHDYLTRYTSFFQDVNLFTDIIPLLVIGAPTWTPTRSFQRGLAARGRLHKSLTAVYRRIRQYQNGERVDFDADMSDISNTTIDRHRVYDHYGVSLETTGHIELALLWAQNINTQIMMFWFLFYIHSTPDLLSLLRQELATSGAISVSAEGPPQITAIDIAKLGRECLLLKSSFLETFRLVEESIMFRYVTQPIEVDDGRRSQQLRPGSWLSVSNCLTKHDPSFFPDPLKFVPDRFIEKNATDTGSRSVSFKTLRPFGIGVGMCKGRTYAEKQVLVTVAAIISLWELEPVGGKWEHPGFEPGGTVLGPIKQVQVRIRRREFGVADNQSHHP